MFLVINIFIAVLGTVLVTFGSIMVNREGVSARNYDQFGMTLLFGLMVSTIGIVGIGAVAADALFMWVTYGVVIGVTGVLIAVNTQAWHSIAMERVNAG